MIRKIASIAALVAALGATGTAPASATPQDLVVTGRTCSFASVAAPGGGGTYTAELTGGPVAATDPAATVELTCSIHVGAANLTHAGADACAVSSGPSPQVAAIPPTPCTYVAADGDPVTVCAQVVVNGVTWYRTGAVSTPLSPLWHQMHGDHRGLWSTDPNAGCTGYATMEWPPAWVTNELETVIVTLVDPAACLALAAAAPGVAGVLDVDPTGDTYLFGEFLWDCPPYAW